MSGAGARDESESRFEDAFWSGADGLKLHYRRYPAAGPAGVSGNSLPVLCLHGLTRNARDFHNIAVHLAAKGHDVVVPEMRGRGMSDPASEIDGYQLPHYAADVEALLADLGWPRFVVIGTSMGGLITLLLAETDAARIAGAVINDIGPELHLPGLRRIGEAVGRSTSFPTWVHAARALMENGGAINPDWELADWIADAKRRMRLTSAGKIVFDYDQRIGQAFVDPDTLVASDAWAEWTALKQVPVLLLRGALSDLLAPEVAERAVAAVDDARLVTVDAVGHAPTLDEPQAREAIDAFLARLDA